MKFMPIDQDDDDDDGNLDFDSMAAKIAADGGCVVVPDNVKPKMLSKTKRPGDADNSATPAADASAAAKEKEEEPVEYDEHGKVASILAHEKMFFLCSLLAVSTRCACILRCDRMHALPCVCRCDSSSCD